MRDGLGVFIMCLSGKGAPPRILLNGLSRSFTDSPSTRGTHPYRPSIHQAEGTHCRPVGVREERFLWSLDLKQKYIMEGQSWPAQTAASKEQFGNPSGCLMFMVFRIAHEGSQDSRNVQEKCSHLHLDPPTAKEKYNTKISLTHHQTNYG